MEPRLVSQNCLLLSLLLPAAAQLRVMSPETLVGWFADTQGRIDGSTSTFGAPFYGERLLGRLVYGESKQNHCKPEDYEVPEPDKTQVRNHEKVPVQLLHIIIVRSGNCSFVTKVLVAQNKGAHAVVIVDSEDSKLSARQIRKIIVAGGGLGNQVKIPSVLISQGEGKHLIEAATGSQAVIVELAWDVPTDHVVMVDLWMSSASQESNRFLTEFAPRRRALDGIKFVPHYHVFGMEEGGASNGLCWDNTAQFCAEDPDGAGSITGKMVLEEDVRQLCVHQIYGVKHQYKSDTATHEVVYAKQYWDYVERFMASCPLDSSDTTKQFGRTCSERVMTEVGVDRLQVQKCVQTSATEKLQQQRDNIAWSPRALRINGWRYSGPLDADLVTRAICAGFVKLPVACNNLVEPVKPFQLPTEPTGFGLGTLVLVILGVVGAALAAMFCYRRSLAKNIQSALREEVMLEVQAQMASYTQMDS